MPSWWTDLKYLDVLLPVFTVIASLLGSALLWIANMGGLRTLSGWLSSHEELTRNEAIHRIKKGLTAIQPDANALECVNELVAGLDQWQLARQRTNGRTAGLRRSVFAYWFFYSPLFADGYPTNQAIQPATSNKHSS